MKPKTWYALSSGAGIANLDILGEIGFWGVTGESVAQQIAATGASRVNVRINSPGGNAADGVAIYNLLKDIDCTVEIIGMAASAASVIAMAGREITMRTGSTMMIHNAWSGAAGNAEELRQTADQLDAISAGITDIYMTRAKISREEIETMMEKETVLTADEAIAAGLADGKSAGNEPMAYAEPEPTPEPEPEPEPEPTAEDPVAKFKAYSKEARALALGFLSHEEIESMIDASEPIEKIKSSIIEKARAMAKAPNTAGRPAPVAVAQVDVLATWRGLTGPAKTKFYEEHKSEINKAMGGR